MEQVKVSHKSQRRLWLDAVSGESDVLSHLNLRTPRCSRACPFSCVAFSSLCRRSQMVTSLSFKDGPHAGSQNGAPHHARLQLLVDDDLEDDGGVDGGFDVGFGVVVGDGVVIGRPLVAGI